MGLLAGLATFIADVIAGLGYPGLFLMMVGESMIFPVPSEVVMPFAGYLVWLGRFGMVEVLAVSLAGSIVGSLLSYELGRRGGRPLVERYGPYFLVGHKELEWTDRFFARHGATAVFISRFIPAVRHVISIPAGTARMPMRTFLPATILGALGWNAFLAFAGFELGPRWPEIGAWFAPYESAILGIGVVCAALFIGYKVREARQPRPAAAEREAVAVEPLEPR